jgi:hypothetical protein
VPPSASQAHLDGLKEAQPEMEESADLVLYWWDYAADLLIRRGTVLRRFGFVTTNSITQVFNRRVVERHLNAKKPISLVLAIPDHPWTKATPDAEAVRIAISAIKTGTLFHQTRAAASCISGCSRMSVFTAADSLHRLVKQALDSGEAASIAEAEALFASYRLALRLDEPQAQDAHHQAALLSAVALARRVFLGGVTVAAPSDLPLLAPLPFGRTLGEAIVALGGSIAPPPDGVSLLISARCRGHGKARFMSARCSRAGGVESSPRKLTYRLRLAQSWRSHRCSPPRSRSTTRYCSSLVSTGLPDGVPPTFPCGIRRPTATGSVPPPTSWRCISCRPDFG